MSTVQERSGDRPLASGSASRRSFLQASLAALVAATAKQANGFPELKTDSKGLLSKPGGEGVGGDFTFFHFSDSHIDPRLTSQAFDPSGRSVQALRWIADSTGREIVQSKYGFHAEPPHFAIHTGDVFEYSVIDRTWSDWESAASQFKCPIAPIPGNHDNTWGEINRELRKRFGDDSYSFDFGGCHFVCLNSAGLLDPLPAWDRRTLGWLAKDLATVDRKTPVFLAMHHPLSDDAGYASSFDKLRFWDVVQNHNIVLAMDGHWHTVHQRSWQDFDRVNGGATFGVHTGYNSVTIRDNVLRVVFHYWQENDARPRNLEQVALIEKPIHRQRPKRPYSVQPVAKAQVPFGDKVRSIVRLKTGAAATAKAWIDGASKKATSFMQQGRRLSAHLATESLIPGWHFVTTRVEPADHAAIEYADSFWLCPPADAPYTIAHHQGAAGIKTPPVVADNLVVVGDTAGVVTALTFELQPAWRYATNSQIVHSVAASNGVIVVGDIDGVVHALDAANGDRLWTTELPNAIYAPAAFTGDDVVLADSSGMVHALRLKTGSPNWSQKVADFGFEARPVVHDEMILAGAWDGRLYALRSGNGDLAWKAWCPSWHADQKSRYYAAADASPVVVNGQILLTDRGYRLGRYSLQGEFLGQVRPQVAAVAANSEGSAFYTRGLDHRLVKHAGDGTKLWSHATPLGRAPTAPMVCGNQLAVVSDKGHLCVVEDANGAELFSLSVSPSLFVLSGIGSDGNQRLFTADMDGRLTAIHLA